MTNIRTQLQQQYNKLQARINKAIKSGKFYQYTAHKQQQLQARLQRYALQMRQLAKGVAVCAALGVALPASAQYTPPGFLMHSGNANPIDGFWNMSPSPSGDRLSSIAALTPTLYDIDGDGDLDMFAAEGDLYNNKRFHFHENTGTAQNPQYSLTPSTNPIPRNELLMTPNCVDIDNDGDLDCFSMHRVPYYDSVKVYYFRNDGSATAPNYTEISGSTNPLDSMNLYNYDLSGMWPGSCSFQFVDIDNDGDYDVYISKGLYYPTGFYFGLYFENTGSSSSPVFTRKLLSQTPLPNVKATCIVDFDKDGDMDVLGSYLGYGETLEYWENTGTASLSQFQSASSPTLNTPLDSIQQIIQDLNGLPSTVNYYNKTGYLQCVDIDGDGDLDVFSAILRSISSIDSFELFFFENLDTTITTNTTSLATEDDLTIYPNPTTGILMFNRPMIGQLRCYNQLGQVFVDKRLLGDMWVDLSALEKGVYFMAIETEKMRIRKKVVIE